MTVIDKFRRFVILELFYCFLIEPKTIPAIITVSVWLARVIRPNTCPTVPTRNGLVMVRAFVPIRYHWQIRLVLRKLKKHPKTVKVKFRVCPLIVQIR